MGEKMTENQRKLWLERTLKEWINLIESRGFNEMKVTPKVKESEVPDSSERPTAPPKKPNMNFEDDNVNHPSHYTKGNIECLDAIEEAVPDPASYLTGNILKYMWRWQHKNGVEDLKKAQFYLNRLIESEEGKT